MAFAGKGAKIWLSESSLWFSVSLEVRIHLRPNKAELGLWSEVDLARMKVDDPGGRWYT